MKKLSNPGVLSILCAFAGAVCLAARMWLLGSTDEKGLLATTHPGGIASWVVMAAAAVLIGYALWGKKPRFAFPPAPLNGVGTLLSALGFACAAWTLFSSKAGLLENLAAVVAVLCLLCAAVRGVLRLQGKRPSAPLYFPAVLFFLLFLLIQYRHWSAEPELQRYFFALAAHVCIMLASYYRAAAEGGFGKSNAYLICSCGGIFFCLAAATDLWLFYIPMAAHLLLDNCSLVEKKPRPAQEA